MNNQIDEEYQNSNMPKEEYYEAQQEAHWDVAWQIFDEIN